MEFIVLFICISLMTNHIQYHFMLAISVTSLEIDLFQSFNHLKN